MRFGGVLKVGPFDDGIDRARLLAESTEDAFGHINIISRGAAAAICARLHLDGDGLLFPHMQQ